MDEASYREWWPLHLRVARGEVLSDGERVTYEAGLEALHRSEALPGEVERLREARAAVEALEAEQAALRERRERLDAEIAALEAALDIQAYSLLTARD